MKTERGSPITSTKSRNSAGFRASAPVPPGDHGPYTSRRVTDDAPPVTEHVSQGRSNPSGKQRG